MESSEKRVTRKEREARWHEVDEILRSMDAIPVREDAFDPLEWDENGLPI